MTLSADAPIDSAPRNERLHGLDAVRGFALVLGVVLHATMSFFPGPQLWIVADHDRSTTLSVLFFVIHVMRMTAFFLIAGFFGRMVFHRVGWRRFVADRVKRIAVPLVAGWPIVFAAIAAVTVAVAVAASRGGVPTEPPPLPAFTPRSFPLTHLWFLYVLLLCYAGALLLRGVVAAGDGAGRFRSGVDRMVRGLMGPWAPFLLALPVVVALYRHPYWVMWFGIPTPDSSLYPNMAAMVGYGTGFGIGWLVHRQMHVVLPRWERQWRWHLALAITTTTICLMMVGPTPLLMPVPQGARKLGYALSYGIATWSWTLALIGMGLRFLAAPSPARRYLADASYWIYLAHLPLVMALQLLVARLSWPWQVKLPLILAVAFALLLLSYHWFVRSTFIGAVLNGRRHPRRPVRDPLVIPSTA